MAISKITQFVTSDGTLHDSKAEAQRHECDIKAKEKIMHILLSSLSTGRKEAVAQHILIECDKIVDVIRDYKRSLPKVKIEAQ